METRLTRLEALIPTLATREDLLRGGSHGPAVVPFDAKSSSLIDQINHVKEPHMPDGKPKLSAEVIAKITAWINDGAPYSEPLIAGKKPKRDASVVTNEDRQWWAFQPLAKVTPPAANGLPNPIDRFYYRCCGQEKSETRSAGGEAKAREHFIEDEDDSCVRRDFANGFEITGQWPGVGHRLENDGGNGVASSGH